jgi:hypothetical protein
LIIFTGIDMMYAFLLHYYGDDEAAVQTMINGVEYAPHTDPHWDPFSIVHNVSNYGVWDIHTRSLMGCVFRSRERM